MAGGPHGRHDVVGLADSGDDEVAVLQYSSDQAFVDRCPEISLRVRRGIVDAWVRRSSVAISPSPVGSSNGSRMPTRPAKHARFRPHKIASAGSATSFDVYRNVPLVLIEPVRRYFSP
jgi:hypothetical protein